MYNINFWPILVASAVSFGIGALWYSPILFGKEWVLLTKTTATDMESAKYRGLWKAYIAQFIAVVICFSVLGFLASANNILTSSDGAFLGFIIWLGFVATESVGALLWERRPFKLVLINIVCTLVSLVVGGAIIGAWK
jgi:hypothetical protein